MGGTSNVVPTKAEKELWARFGLSYQRNRLPVMQRIERSVCGYAYGGTSWATRKEMDFISKKLALRQGQNR